MSRVQKAVRIFIRLMLPVFALGGFGAIWSLSLVGESQATASTILWSPDHRYRASIVGTSGSNGCGSGTSSSVVIAHKSLIFNVGEFEPFCFAGPPDHINLRWDDSETLSVSCSGCAGQYEVADENWGKLHFVYDLDKP